MPDIVVSTIISAVAGALSGYASAFWLEHSDRERRRKAVASALLYELRLMEANMRDTAAAAQPTQQAAGVDYPMHDALLAELVLFKPSTVEKVLTAYGWFRDLRHKMGLVREGVFQAGPERDRDLRIWGGHGVRAVPAAYKALKSEGGVEPTGDYWEPAAPADQLPESPFKSSGPRG